MAGNFPEPDLTADDGVAPAPCRWCGETHSPICPWVKAYEFADDGRTVRRVEFFAPKDWLPEARAEEPPAPDYPRKPAMKG